VLEGAFVEAEQFKDEFVSAEHILLALATVRDPRRVAGQTRSFAGGDLAGAHRRARPSHRVTSQSRRDLRPSNNTRGPDRTGLPRKLDPVIGRDDEIRRVMQILARRTKIIPCSSASRRVKTAVVEVWHSALFPAMSEVLRPKRIVALDLAALVAGQVR
jgi:ATP-dependent Clp protease ATP-binding subunit ClpB